jgi:hypothetical protein
LVEPRINIRQKLSDQFALKLEENLKSIYHSNSGFEDDFLGVEKKTLEFSK